MTMNEVFMYSEIYKKRKEQESEDAINMTIINAYYTEVFRRQDRSKKLPPLDKFLIKFNETKNKPKQSPEQNIEKMMETAKALTLMFGGKINVIDN